MGWGNPGSAGLGSGEGAGSGFGGGRGGSGFGTLSLGCSGTGPLVLKRVEIPRRLVVGLTELTPFADISSLMLGDLMKA